MITTDGGRTHGPPSITKLRAEAYNLPPRAPAQVPTPERLTVPRIGVEALMRMTTNLSSLPDAPELVRCWGSALPGAEKGTIVVARSYTTTGDPVVVLVDCSGPSVSDAGGDELGRFSYGLVLEVVPAEASG